MSKKKLFSIPSIGDIKEFEKKKPEVKSHFKSGSSSPGSSNKDDANHPTSASSSSLLGKRTSVRSSSANRTHTTKPPDSNTNNSNITNVTSTGKRPHSTNRDIQLPVIKLKKTDADKESLLRTSTELRKSPGGEISRLLGGSNGQVPAKVQAQETSEIDMQPPKLTPIPNPASTSAGPSKAIAPNSIVVNARQRGNPILKHVRNVPWQFGDIVPDYVMGRTVCALYLSLRYHHLNPNYIHDRLKELGRNYELRVLLVQVDVKDPHHSLKELARMAILADCTLLLAWSAEEAGRYLETYKAYENKPADALKEKVEQDFLSRVQDCLTTVKSVKKNDVVSLLTTFGTVDKIMAASKEDLSLVPGFGSLKAQRLHSSFHEPFLKSKQAAKQDKDQ